MDPLVHVAFVVYNAELPFLLFFLSLVPDQVNTLNRLD
jgi:hypothetical protein